MKYKFPLPLITIIVLFFMSSCVGSGNFNIAGIVKSKEIGKDGYTAYFLGNDGKNYSAVISKVNMDHSFEYQELGIGAHVKVYGDSINLGYEIIIKVTKIKKR
jgi:hypothetical protein